MLDLHRVNRAPACSDNDIHSHCPQNQNSCGYLTQSAFDVVAAAAPVANRGLTPPPPPPPPPAPPPAPLPPLPLYPKSATRPMRSNEQIATDEYQIDDRDDPLQALKNTSTGDCKNMHSRAHL
uniref:Uncharacterized protein n=1 Tax=Glossina palpalis gambiensis TaxID=67801 RepID=A0A1B0AWS0_9MUSC